MSVLELISGIAIGFVVGSVILVWLTSRGRT
jgi:tetrahydromethanopterin S-methyltransferase subunit F